MVPILRIHVTINKDLDERTFSLRLRKTSTKNKFKLEVKDKVLNINGEQINIKFNSKRMMI